MAFKDFAKAVMDVNASAASKRKMLATTARSYLKKQKEKAQATGDLEKVLVFKNALESTRDDVFEGDDEAIVRLRESYAQQLTQVDRALLIAGLSAGRVFAETLDEQKKETTKKGDLANAQKIAAFQKKVQEWTESIQEKVAGVSRHSRIATSDERRYVAKTHKTTREQKPLLAGERKIVCVGLQEIAFRWCPPGSFTMGSSISEKGRNADETQHKVILTKGFWMGETEVTQGLWKEVMGTNPSRFKIGDNYPVEGLSWNNCQDFLNTINVRPDVGGKGLRFALPTEAQWEYACRAGSMTSYFWGNSWNGNNATGNLDNGRRNTTSVGSYKANAWGLYDMHGNVWTWCQDWYGEYPSDTATDPLGAPSGTQRVLRGGSWVNPASRSRSAFRGRNSPEYRDPCLGIRVVLIDGK